MTNSSLPTTSLRRDDALAFRRLATMRTNNALKYIRLIGNLSNKSNYAYSLTDTKKIFDALREALNETEKRFEEAKIIKVKFILED